MKCFQVALALSLLIGLPTIEASQGPPAKTPATPSPRATGSLAQIMRGIYFPNSNVIFDVQENDPGAPRKKSSTEPGASVSETYASTYTGWEAVENAAVALTDGVDLILRPGRSCQNGKPVPIRQADFQKFARDMRTAGLTVLQAARTRNQEKVSDATNNLA